MVRMSVNRAFERAAEPWPQCRISNRRCRRSCSDRALLCFLVFVYGFIVWTGVLSFTKSRLLPSYEFVGVAQ